MILTSCGKTVRPTNSPQRHSSRYFSRFRIGSAIRIIYSSPGTFNRFLEREFKEREKNKTIVKWSNGISDKNNINDVQCLNGSAFACPSFKIALFFNFVHSFFSRTDSFAFHLLSLSHKLNSFGWEMVSHKSLLFVTSFVIIFPHFLQHHCVKFSLLFCFTETQYYSFKQFTNKKTRKHFAQWVQK